MRSLPTPINDALTTQGAQPGYLVKIECGAGTFYLTSLDQDFSWDDKTWLSSDITLSGMTWTTAASPKVKMVLGDASLAWWALAGNFVLQDAQTYIWQVYADATNEAEPLWQGRIGLIKKGEMTLECELITDNALRSSPRRRIQTLIPAKYLLPPGTEIELGATKWPLWRKRK